MDSREKAVILWTLLSFQLMQSVIVEYVDLWIFDERILWFSGRPIDVKSCEVIFTRSIITVGIL